MGDAGRHGPSNEPRRLRVQRQDAVVAAAEHRQQLILRESGNGGRGRKIIIELDPVALRESGGGIDDDGGEVHRDTSGHRQSGAPGKGPARVGKAAQIAVGIADIEDGELGRPLGGEGRIVSDRPARRDAAALDDLGLDARDLADGALRFAPRHAAVEGEAGAGEVEGIVAAEADAGAVGEAEPAMRNARATRRSGAGAAARSSRRPRRRRRGGSSMSRSRARRAGPRRRPPPTGRAG